MKIILMVLSLCIIQPVFAQTPIPPQTQVQVLAQSIQSSSSITTDQFIADAITAVGQFGQAGMPVGLKIALITLMIIALMKVSVLSSFWAKLGNFQAILSPILAIAIGYIFYSNGAPFQWSTTLAFFASGVGATGLHEVLDMIKAIPGLGSAYVSIINLIEGALGGSSPTVSP